MVDNKETKISKPLNSRQRLFCINLASGLNQTEAYIKAGYDDTEAASSAATLLHTNPSVQAYYKELCSRHEAAVMAEIMSPLERKARLSEIARAKLIDFQDAGGEPGLTKDTPNNAAASKYYHRKRKDHKGNEIVTKNIELTNPIEAIKELNKMDGSYAPVRHDVRQVSFKVTMVDEKKE